MESSGADAVAMALLDDDHHTSNVTNDSDGNSNVHKEDGLELDAVEDEHDESTAAINADEDAEADTAFFQDAIAPSTSSSLAPNAPVSAHAPLFPTVHGSWEAFDAQLKTYAQSTYQLYVVRTTTSVNRRNLRIAELAAVANGASTVGVGVDVDVATEEALEDREDAADHGMRASHDQSDRLMIPAHLKWYSKTMMCTHGWKNRHRGTGKRSLTMVRSTGCPVKMCITLQHTNDVADGDERDDGWRVVVTKHVRTHNHPLSKELYLFYTENRRIYDPELLALVGGTSPSDATLTAELYDAFGEDDDESTVGNNNIALGQGETASIPWSVALMTPKAFNSWEHFHEVLGDYILTTQQHFRIRSTISTQSKNAKTLEQATKTGKNAEEVAVHLVPEAQKWFSKLLICNHGWKRKSRSKVAKLQRREDVDGWTDANPTACPAMIMARLQRDIHDKWRIVINRQIIRHNHALSALDVSEGDHDVRMLDGMMPSDLEEGPTPTVAVTNATEDDVQNEEFVNAAVRHLGDLQLPSSTTTTSEQNHAHTVSMSSTPTPVSEPSAQSTAEMQVVPRPMSVVTEVVVRVAKLPAVHASWDSFHACLRQYSEITYQSYRTRTTSSVAGRNHKIMEMRTGNEGSMGNLSVIDEEGLTARDGAGPDATRLIPEHYKWYSKTLTCTHGWKERRRGTGKRTIHVVRSTLCPVKICATLQYLEADATNATEVGWRVVVTKHIVDHNHNLSKELYLHYSTNRRIYDPALLAINQTNAAGVPSSNLQAPPTSTGAVASAPSAEEQQAVLFSSGAPVGFDHTDAFNAQHALPESAYMVANPANPTQQILLMANGLTLVSFTTVPTSTTTQLQSSTATPVINVATSTAMQQLFAHGSMFPSASYSTVHMPEPAGNTAQGVPSTTNVICQLHGTASSNPSSGAESAECTCLRIPIVQHYTTGGTTAPPLAESTNSAGKRCPRGSEERQDIATPVPKRARLEAGRADAGARNGTDTLLADVPGVPGTTVESTYATGPPGPVWSPENPLQAMAVTDATDGTVVWRAPRFKPRHESWTEFTNHLETYSVATLQLYRVRTTSSIAARNVRIAQQLQQLQEDGDRIEPHGEEEVVPHLVPTSYEWYSKTYVCTHGWKERRRGKGQRVSHNLRSTACPVKLCVTLQRDPHDTENWHVVVTKHVLDHNHEISPSLFQSYSENRRIKDPELLAHAERMWREGHPRRKVFEFLKTATKTNLVMKDIHNLVQRWQQQQQHPPAASMMTATTSTVYDGAEPEPDLELIV